MINLYRTTIEELSLHYVGNKNRGEKLFLSEQPHRLSPDLIYQLNTYFFKPFRDKEENYFQFDHQTNLDFNEIYKYAKNIFENPNKFHENSKNIASHLYDQCNHSHIKDGELYITLLDNCELDNKIVQAIGIFKSEVKNNFFQFRKQNGNLQIKAEEGVNINKLDKACLIFNVNTETGFKILTLDTNRYDTKYWTNYFLNVTACHDKNFQTKSFLKLCKDFSKDVIFNNEDSKEQIKFFNKSLDFFSKRDEFKQDEFIENVVTLPEYKQKFVDYKEKFIKDYNIDDFTDFEITNKTVSTIQRKFKKVIDLDTNVEIRMKFRDEKSAEEYLEKGWDEEKGMYYYLVYFNEEKK